MSVWEVSFGLSAVNLETVEISTVNIYYNMRGSVTHVTDYHWVCLHFASQDNLDMFK